MDSSGSLRKRGRLLLFGTLIPDLSGLDPISDPRFEPEQTTAFLLWIPPVRCESEVVCSFSGPSYRTFPDSIRSRTPALNQSKRPRFCFGFLRFVAKKRSFAPFREPSHRTLPDSIRSRTPASSQSKRPRFCCGFLRFVAKKRSFAPFRDPHTGPFRTRSDLAPSRAFKWTLSCPSQIGRCEGAEKEQTTSLSQ